MSVFQPVLDGRTAERVEATIKGGRPDVKGTVFRGLIIAALVFSLLILLVLLISVLTDGWDTLSSRLGGFLNGSLRSRSEDELLGVHQGLYGSLWIGIFTALIAFPLGIGAALYLEEYAPRNRLTSVLELAIRNLAGVPSVVYGLLGLFLFVETDWIADLTGGQTVISAGLTLAFLVLPIVIITAQEAVRSVPQELKEGAYGVGATKWTMIRSQMLPYAAPGILTGTLLSMSRAIGEAAPLILIGAISGGLTKNPGLFEVSALDERFTALPINIVTWTQQSGRDPGFATAAAAGIVVLLVVVLILNLAAIVLRNHFEKKRG